MKKLVILILTFLFVNMQVSVLAYGKNDLSKVNKMITEQAYQTNHTNPAYTTNPTYSNVQLPVYPTTQQDEDVFKNNYQNLNLYRENITGVQNLSRIEQLFNGKEVDITQNPLLQVGYNYFTAPIVGTSMTGKYDDSYKFSIGEKVSAYLYGDSVDIMAISGANLLSPVIQTEVDSKGNIFIGGIGVVQAENKTIKEVESSINKLANAKYKNLKIKLNVASGQDFSVFVYGQVNKPGKVIVNNNSSIMDALGAAGGVKKTGTLRKIQYTSNKKTKEVDLYKTIFAGNDNNIILRPNDKIFVG